MYTFEDVNPDSKLSPDCRPQQPDFGATARSKQWACLQQNGCVRYERRRLECVVNFSLAVSVGAQE